jgi:hypothetical protein
LQGSGKARSHGLAAAPSAELAISPLIISG